MIGVEEMFKELLQPEYLHVLLNPFLTHGTALGIISLVLATLMRSRPAQVVALVLIALSCGSFWLVQHYGHLAYDRAYAMSYSDARGWLDLHESRAERYEWLFYGTALTAMAAILVPLKLKRAALPLVLLSLVLAVAALAASGWIAHAGGKIRHDEFRAGPPPEHVEAHEHQHEH